MSLITPHPINVYANRAGPEIHKHFETRNKSGRRTLHPPSNSSTPASTYLTPPSRHPSSFGGSSGGSSFSDVFSEGSLSSPSPGPLEATCYAYRSVHQAPIGMPRQRPIWLTRFLEMFPKKPFDSPAARAMEEFRVKLTKQMAHESNRPILPTSTLARRRHGDRVPRPQHMDANPLGPTFGPKYTRDEEDQPLHHVNDTYGGCARESQHPRPVRYRSPQHRHETSHKPKIPLWEEPYLFAGVRAMERPNTRDLVDENDEYLVSTRPPPNAVWSHNPRPQPLSMARGPRNNLWRPRAAPAQQEYHNHNFKRHSISLNGPVPLHSVHPESLQRNYPLYNPFVIRGINRLLDDHDEETEAYLDSHCPRSEALAAAKACPKHHVINRRAHDRFAEVRRLHSPPENRRRLDEATNDDFGDFPDCEMSRAMGLHTRM